MNISQSKNKKAEKLYENSTLSVLENTCKLLSSVNTGGKIQNPAEILQAAKIVIQVLEFAQSKEYDMTSSLAKSIRVLMKL